MTRMVRPLSWRERKLCFKVGSIMRGCAGCGSHDVFRSFSPGDMGWWHYCYTCSRKDQDCWPTEKPAPYKSAREEARDKERAEMLAASQRLGDESPAYHLLTPAEQRQLRIAQARSMDAKLAADGLNPKPRKQRSAVNAKVSAISSEIASIMSQLKALGVAV